MTNNVKKLRTKYGLPSERASKKVLPYLKEEVISFIEQSPFAVLSTSDIDGNCDASPRGGLPGFIKIIDENTLFIPDIKGNRLFQSFENFESNPKAGLIFFIPGSTKMVRVNGRVKQLDKQEISALVESIEVFKEDENSEYIQGFLLFVDEAYTHCPRALAFSDLWNVATIITNKK